jgi:hypothetical protein
MTACCLGWAMSFKKLLLVLIGFQLTSCSDYLRGQKRSAEAINITEGQFACLKKLPDTLALISDGEVPPAEVETSFKCLEQALLYFRDRTTGTYPDGYTALDFRKFFGKYFLKKNNISENLAEEIVHLKAALLGGKIDVVSKDEVTQLAAMTGVLREEIVRMLPHIPLILLTSKTADESQIAAAIATLKISAVRLLKATTLQKSDYTFDDTHLLVENILAFIGSARQSDLTDRFGTYWPVFESLKKILLGERAHLQGIEDWSEALVSFVDLFELGLRQHYLLENVSLKSPVALTRFGDTLEKGVALLENSLQMKRHGSIPCVEIDEVIDQLADSKLMKIPLSSETLKETYRIFFGKLVDGQKFKVASDLLNLSERHLEAFKKEIHVWRQLQVWIDSVATVGSTMTWPQVLDRLPGPKVLSDPAWQDFSSLLRQQRPVTFNDEGRFVLEYDPKNEIVSWSSLSLSNLIYVLTRLMMAGYGEPQYELQKTVMVESQLVRWYDDFQLLGLEIKAFDRRNINAGKRSFKEANFFTPSGNGDTVVSFNELYEYIGLLVGSGMGSVGQSRIFAAQDGCEVDKIDAFDLKMFRESCFKDSMKKNLPSLFNNLPHLVDYFRVHPQNWDVFYTRLMDAARIETRTDGLIEHGDLRTFIMMMHYQESLMVVFDKDRDGYLDISEINEAYPRFATFIKETTQVPWFVKFADDWLLQNGFIYLITEGHRPSGTDWITYAWNRFTSHDQNSSMKADRVGLAKVFQSLKDELKKH